MKNSKIRQHPSIILHECLRLMFLVLFFLIGLLQENSQTNAETFFGPSDMLAWVFCFGIFIVLAVIAIWRYFVWKRTFIMITDDAFVYDKRTRIFKKKVSLRLEQISTVNLQATILNRCFDTYTVKLDINSSVTADNTDFKLVLKKEVAHFLQREIAAARQKATEFDEAVGGTLLCDLQKQSNTPVLRFGLGYIVRHSLVATSLGTIIAFGVVLAGVSVPFLEFSQLVISLMLAVGIPATLILSVVFIIVRDIFRYYGFTVSREKGNLSVTFGLITRRSYRLSIDKVNALVIRQGVLGRISGMYYIEMLNVGMGEEKENISPIFCLCVNKFYLEWVIKTMVPEFADTLEFVKPPKKALLPQMVKGFIWFFIIGIVLVLSFVALGETVVMMVGLPLLLLIWVAVSYAAYRAKGIATNDRLLLIATGVLSRRIIIVPFAKVQKIKVIKGPVGRIVGVRRGVISILATAINQNNPTGYFMPETFEKIVAKTKADLGGF